MVDEHVSRILKMLEEGKISAAEAESLISALRAERAAGAGAGAPPRPGSAAPPPPPGEGTSKSFEFRWGQRRTFPFDLSSLGKQISDAVKRIDPERMMREAGIGRGKRWQERLRNWRLWSDEEEGAPENTAGHPTARSVETQTFEATFDATVQVENNLGSITVTGGADTLAMEVEKEAWAPTEEEAQARLAQMTVDAAVHTPDMGSSRLEVRVTAPEDWRDGLCNLRLRVPDAARLRLATLFGEIRVENVGGSAEVHTVSGDVTLAAVRGDARAETLSGNLTAAQMGAAVQLATKSGQVKVEGASRGAAVSSISGDVRVARVEGGRVEAKSVSGDVAVESVGAAGPLDIHTESVSGDVRLVEAHGNITLKSVSGDVLAEKLDAITLQGQTVSGDVDLALATPFVGTLTANTVSGDVAIQMPDGSSFRFTLVTQSGDLACGQPVSDGSRTETLWSGTVGAGAGTVNIQTLSGDVRLGRPE